MQPIFQHNNHINNKGEGAQSLLYAEIIIPLALPKNYTWSIPENFKDVVSPGVRVEVNLGKKKRYAGIVKKILTEKPEHIDPKPIINVLDTEPVIYSAQLQLWEWIADYYMCSEGEVMMAAIPANLKLTSETILVWNEEHDENFTGLDDKEFLVAEALLLKKQLKLQEVQQILDATHVYPIIDSLLQKNICYVWEELQEKYREKTETYVHLHANYYAESKLKELLDNSKAPKQMELLLSYLHLFKIQTEVTQQDLLKKSNASLAQLKALTEKNILVIEKRFVYRNPALPKKVLIDFTLSAAQERALEEINVSLDTRQVCLLHGATASGKTQLYIKLIEAAIATGKQVLYMLPEIALTAQIIRRLQKHFGGNISIYHSKFNANERVEIWNRVKNGDINIILGARSALFLPFKNLGLIICDEEHETSYKQQEPAPRYHARDAAIYYATLLHAHVVLGSATPSVESFYNTEIKKYGLVSLPERFGSAGFPDIELIDLSKIISKEKIIISPQLQSAMELTLAAKKQVIVFKNRRGYSPYLICNVCGWIPQCKDCDVTLTYHKAKNKMVCHYCGTQYPVLHLCISCGSHDFKQRNFGTEKIEEVIVDAFPEAKTARMDLDSIRGKNAHDNLIKLFEQQRIDILVGTQMVVKGLDFEWVDLVGIIDADSILFFADFRVNERAFQLMEQVSGRAGRKEKKGRVLIQVYNMHHPVLQFVQQHDYHKMYAFEIPNRQNFFYPPFSRLIRITIKHSTNTVAAQAADLLAEGLRKFFLQYVNGPAQPVVNRVRNKYLWELLLKLPRKAETIRACKIEIENNIGIIHFEKTYKGVQFVVDVDPI